MATDLSPENEKFIQTEIATGTFGSREEAIDAGIDMLVGMGCSWLVLHVLGSSIFSILTSAVETVRLAQQRIEECPTPSEIPIDHEFTKASTT